MCCYNNVREKWIISLVLVGVFFSLGVAVPMILISYPGNECLLFVSVRGESLIYGHPAGCNFISASHCLIALSALVFFIVLLACRRSGASNTNVNKNPSNGSVRSLRGSITGQSMASHFGPAAKPTITLITFSMILFWFVLISTIVMISGYVVTCGELQYETRRKLYGSLTLGSQVSTVSHMCWSLFRDTDYHTRFHFDHAELSGQWHGPYTAYRHGRPQTWTGSANKQLIDVATALEMCIGCTTIGTIIWGAITLLLLTHRKSVKVKQKKEIAESIEDARIWASDMSPINGGINQNHYEKINMRNLNQQYESIKNMQVQSLEVPPPPSDSSDVDTLLAHQNVIANTHPDGSYFMTNEGQYVQLVNGVLTHVEFQPSPPPSVQYTPVQFPAQSYYQTQSLPHQQVPPVQPQHHHSVPPLSQPDQPDSLENYTKVQQLSRPLMSSSPVTASVEDNTRMNMRIQRDAANAAGIKCSQF